MLILWTWNAKHTLLYNHTHRHSFYNLNGDGYLLKFGIQSICIENSVKDCTYVSNVWLLELIASLPIASNARSICSLFGLNSTFKAWISKRHAVIQAVTNILLSLTSKFLRIATISGEPWKLSLTTLSYVPLSSFHGDRGDELVSFFGWQFSIFELKASIVSLIDLLNKKPSVSFTKSNKVIYTTKISSMSCTCRSIFALNKGRWDLYQLILVVFTSTQLFNR